jgi:hypothetical protein
MEIHPNGPILKNSHGTASLQESAELLQPSSSLSWGEGGQHPV